MGEKKCPNICATASDIFQDLAEDKKGNIRKLLSEAEKVKPYLVLVEDVTEICNKHAQVAHYRNGPKIAVFL